jgi:hypothetical protein
VHCVGLPSDAEVEMRRHEFGSNVIPPRPSKSFVALCWEGLQDATLIILIGCAVVAIVFAYALPAVKGSGTADPAEVIEGTQLTKMSHEWDNTWAEFQSLAKRTCTICPVGSHLWTILLARHGMAAQCPQGINFKMNINYILSF